MHNKNFITGVIYWLCLLFIFLLPWERLANFGSLGTVSRLVGMMVAALWMFSVVQNGVRRIKPVHGLTFAFCLLNLASIFWSVDGTETVSRAVSYFSGAVMLVLFWDLFRDEQSIRRAFQAYVLGGCVPAGSVVRNYLTANAFEWGRYTSGADNENTTAYTLAITLPFAIYLIAAPPLQGESRARSMFLDWIFRAYNVCYIPFCLFGVALTGTRFAMIMLLPVIGYLMLGLFRTKPFSAVALGVVGCFSAVIMLQFLPGEIVERLASTSDEVSSGDLNGRIGMWKIALETFADSPLIGTGSGTSNAASIPYLGYAFSTHNSFLAILVELGIVGLLLMLAILFCVFRYAWSMPQLKANFWLMVLSVWFLGNLPLTNFHNKPTWLIFGLLACAYFAAKGEYTEPTPSRPVHAEPQFHANLSPGGVE